MRLTETNSSDWVYFAMELLDVDFNHLKVGVDLRYRMFHSSFISLYETE